jgi:surface polysaccharide O-acyltransferase-like enzyme
MYSRNNRRNSSVELFRIIAMLMVVTVHYNNAMLPDSLGMPNYFNLEIASVH